MRRSSSVLLGMLAMFSTAASACAASAPPALPSVPTLPSIVAQPRDVRPPEPFQVRGRHFPGRTTIPLEMDCPRFGKTRYGRMQWMARTNRQGAFTLHAHVHAPRRHHSAVCHIYALDPGTATPFYIRIDLRVR